MADSQAKSSGMSSGVGGGGSHESGGDQSPRSMNVRKQDRFLPFANISRIRGLPANGKIAKDAKETMQECVFEFISFITSEPSDKCQREKRKTINGEDLLWAMTTLGFEEYVEPLKLYLARYKELDSRMRMRKKTTKKTKAEELQTPSGIFTTLFSDEVAEAGESSGFSSIFSVNNPFRQNKPMPATNKPNMPVHEEEGEHRNWADLPPELTSLILHRLSTIEIVERAEKVCRSWRSVCKDPSMWRKLRCVTPSPCNTSITRICAVMQLIVARAGWLRSIYGTFVLILSSATSPIVQEKVTDDGLVKAVVNLPLLEDLEASSGMPKSADVDIAIAQNNAPTLPPPALREQTKRSWIYQKMSITVTTTTFWTLNWTTLPQLICVSKCIGFAVQEKVTDDGLVKAVVNLPLLEDLEVLYLPFYGYCPLSGDILKVVGQSCSNLKTFKTNCVDYRRPPGMPKSADVDIAIAQNNAPTLPPPALREQTKRSWIYQKMSITVTTTTFWTLNWTTLPQLICVSKCIGFAGKTFFSHDI
ncbi:hypothetical protein Bca52824_006729 [Brassica carinata]|uniref:F-box domain-containing protein n=1 Tax=Brassica carinata TaxID=52824 RepID=A0A8X7W620_BRACI|nr:hypothetical protein Bca52824_006729 [Brassica carinata]